MARAAASWPRLRADARAACLRAAPLATSAGFVALVLGACASGPVLQGRGHHGDEYTLEIRGTDPQQRIRQALHDASVFCESQGSGLVPGSAIHGSATTTLTFQCTDERAGGRGAARPAPAYGQ